MAKIVTQLGKSRKYANGTIHENASGKFQILDRFLDDGIVMLKIEWLTGEKSGQIEENKEENINASIYKYEQSRGLLGEIEENKDVVTLRDIYEFIGNLQINLNDNKTQLAAALNENTRILRMYEEDKVNIQRNLQLMEEKLHAQTELIIDMAKQLRNTIDKAKELTKTGDENHNMIREIGMIVDKNTTLIENVTHNVNTLQNQQNLIDKLIEKIK